MFNILVVEDQKNMRESLVIAFKRAGYYVDSVDNGEKAVELQKDHLYDLIIVDLKMEAMDGLEVLSHIKHINPSTEIIVMTAFGTIDSAIQAMRKGAYDYVTKPFQLSDILSVIERALEKKRLLEKVNNLQKETKEKYKFEGIIGNSPMMMRILNILMELTNSESTVLITGESGTGKELVARAIHNNSRRSEKPFVVVNCGALPENLQESELFGHVMGSFTGAVKDKKGIFLEAQGGTLFLDEIGETSLSSQVKLLRFLQNGEIRKVGDNKPLYLDVRIIVATNKDLEEATKNGSFRKDLFYRLNVIRIHLPPLRERKEDIPVLINYFINIYSNKLKRKPPEISGDAMALLLTYPWPGNIRELENVIERSVTLAKRDHITVTDLALQNTPSADTPVDSMTERGGIRAALAQQERKTIIESLRKHAGNRKQAASNLGISTTTLWRKMKEYQIIPKTSYNTEST
ncbi:MAG: sigma-54-dependent Fis family transcriptional regulator [Candidatus Jettenia sp.]|uniref:Two-component response regulator n=1 Tax=Candidatus Jettenia caeni TaxID=247490 RepID=I3IGN3_9BACT|nr:sigma-54 dependent transcriptional regulator [Candidatus Jettenia sp. AMX1]MBC6927843.1 sigma-54-dependent Fis family transcriptional regulator [Candidatus Jettenia sp.]WKZ16215.1 MAG: sigma-54 dependent transcriptional regulator [Candidatus Jettenia caeni]KAA0251252.1 MAG: sigma-54-dependent Fis family transcriptional regulator [Candidatus Jettenia sp. AMX1]MCE7880275.1 sigma-54-dependent Fis family transcriptional regulator [Candidatus Jettenia sp. AMX1]MCQ3926192.1 sigma-54-dependent Fis